MMAAIQEIKNLKKKPSEIENLMPYDYEPNKVQ
jgi:hypothetical protein